MQKDLDLLKRSMKRKRSLSLTDLKEALQIRSDDALMTQIIKLLDRELNNYKFNREHSCHSFLFKCFDYLEYNRNKVNFDDPNEEAYIRLELVQLSKVIENKLANPDRIVRKTFFDNNQEILIKLQDRIANFKAIYEAPEYDDADLLTYIIMHHVVFEIKDEHRVKQIMKEIPVTKKARNADGKSLLQEVVEKYVEAVKQNDNLFNIRYYASIIKLISKSFNDKQILMYIKTIILGAEAEIKASQNLNSTLKYRLTYYLAEASDTLKLDLKCKKEALSFKYMLNNEYSHDLDAEISTCHYDKTNYRDLRHLKVFTIDDYRAKFHEDAFSFKIDDEGNYELGIYITDVDAFIKEHSPLNNEAEKRATALDCYYVSIIPSELRKTILSLNEKQDNPVIAFTFKFDNHAKMIDLKTDLALINVDKNYNYSNVKEVLKKDKSDSLSHILNLIQTRKKNFNGENGLLDKNMEKLKVKEDTIGQTITQELSIFLNLVVANHFSKRNLPFIYHIDHFFDNDELFDYINAAVPNEKLSTPYINALKNATTPVILSPVNYGYHRLNAKAYCDVKSPGCTYTALVNQRMIKRYMINKDYHNYDQIETDVKYITNLCEIVNQRNKVTNSYFEDVAIRQSNHRALTNHK